MFISRHTLKWTKTCRSSGDFPHAHTAHFLLNRHSLIWLVDDADDLLDPLCCDTQAVRFRQALADSSIIVVFAVRSPRHIRVPDHCSTRIVFPCGDRTADLVAGIPSSLVNTMSQEDLDTPGRAVLIAGASACLVQCAS